MKSLHVVFLAFILALLSNNTAGRSFHGTNSYTKEYDTKNIPTVLLEDADAIIRTDVMQFEVKDRQHAVLKTKFAVTVFKKEKRDYGYIGLAYDKFHTIEDLEGTIYDADGKEIRELESKDKKDISAVSGYSLYDDSRVCIAEMYYDQYPYTIEYTYEYSYDGYLNWPAWQSQGTLDAVQQTSFEVTVPEQDSLRYWCNNNSIRPVIVPDGNKKKYTWEAKELPKLSKDVVGEDPEDYAIIVLTAPSLFEYGDYPGDMRTWKEFGKWDFTLLQGRDKLPASAVRDVHSLVQPTDDTKTKIKKLYRYMQDRTRYVSVQLGIGGWQPFSAEFVHERGYGDCKALSNYMVSLLKEAGVNAHSSNIRSGKYRQPFIQEFPSARFNHVIVCVPHQPDTVWLECTSQTIPVSHLTRNTENRGALLLTPEGGIVVHTPRTTQYQNRQIRKAQVVFKNFGYADAHSTVTRSGNQQDYIREALDDATPEERERWILNSLGIPNANLTGYTLEGLENHEDQICLTLHLALPHFASTPGNRIFFMPNLMERQTYIPPDVKQRLSPIRYDYPYLDVDTIFYSLPKDYLIESIPKETLLESSFGKYYSRIVSLGDSVIIYIRSKEIREYSIAANNYPEYRKFCVDIVKADKAQVVLVRKE
jgi:hypothetical protein